MSTATGESQQTGFDVYEPTCPTRLVTSRWGVLVLATLRERTYRFGELRRRLAGVSEKVSKPNCRYSTGTRPIGVSPSSSR